MLGIRTGVGEVQAANFAADDVQLAGGILGPIMDGAGGRPFVAAAAGAIDQFEAFGDGGFHEVGGCYRRAAVAPIAQAIMRAAHFGGGAKETP